MTLSCNVSEILAVLVVYELRATLINTFPTYLYCSNCLPNFRQGLQWRRHLWGTGAAGRVPPRLSTRYFRVIMHFRFAQILTVTRLEKLTLCSVELLTKLLTDFQRSQQSPHCTKLRTVSETEDCECMDKCCAVHCTLFN